MSPQRPNQEKPAQGEGLTSGNRRLGSTGAQSPGKGLGVGIADHRDESGANRTYVRQAAVGKENTSRGRSRRLHISRRLIATHAYREALLRSLKIWQREAR
jgi:hypothetical protein